MNQKKVVRIHTVFVVIYALSLLLPLLSVADWIKFYLDNNLLGDIPEVIFGFESIGFLLLIVSIVQNLKLRRRTLGKAHKIFLISSSAAIILFGILISGLFLSNDDWGFLYYFIILTPPMVFFWILSVIVGFIAMRKSSLN